MKAGLHKWEDNDETLRSDGRHRPAQIPERRRSRHGRCGGRKRAPSRGESRRWTGPRSLYPSNRLANIKDLRVNEPLNVAYPDADAPGVVIKLGTKVDGGLARMAISSVSRPSARTRDSHSATTRATRRSTAPVTIRASMSSAAASKSGARRPRTYRSTLCGSMIRATSTPRGSMSSSMAACPTCSEGG